MTPWKRLLLVGITACSTVVPLVAGAEGSMAATDASAAPAANRPLRQLILGESIDALQTLNPPVESGFVVVSPALATFDITELRKRLSAGEGRPIEERLLAAITQVIEGFFKVQEYPTAAAIVPTQSISDGRVRIVINLGQRAKSVAATEWKIRQVKMQGARWFSESLLREKLRIEQGELVRFSDLDQAISWTNNNPFRRVRVHLEPVPNTGEADLHIAVQDALPLRLTASVDNGGNDIVGRNRYIGGLSYANLWGLDHQISYQYVTTNKPKYYQAHGIDYRVPLAWRHYLQLSGTYFRAQPEFLDGFFLQDGETVTADLRYTVPITQGNNSSELFGALSFKQSNNNLTWDPRADNIRVFGTKTDIFQLMLGASAVRRDKRGAWAFGATLTASPGGINSRNTDEAFDAGRFNPQLDSSRLGATARYAYATLSAQRHLMLGHGWDLMSRAMVQVSQANLLSSEQFTIGGSSSVRGFNENVFAGDHGFLLSNEIVAPAVKTPLPYLTKRRGPLESRFLVFLDMADTAVRRRFASDPPRAALAGAGVGLRASLATNFSLTADYGWQITRLPYQVEDRSRAHVRATFAF